MSEFDDIGALPKGTLLERFAIWLLKIPYAPEERLLRAEQARRLKIKTDIQEARIKARLNKTPPEEYWRLAATWRHSHWQTRNTIRYDVISIFYLEVNDKGTRRVRCGATVRRGSGEVLGSATLDTFHKSRPEWTELIQPWLDKSIETKDLKHEEISVVKGAK